MSAFFDFLFIGLGASLLTIGFFGCVIPVLPGPFIAFLGFLCLRGMGAHTQPETSELLTAGAMTAFVWALDYVLPALGAKRFSCSRWGTAGALIGTFAGLFFLPWGVLLGPFVGAWLGESAAGKAFSPALKGACGALMGFLAALILKLACCTILAVWFFLTLLG